MVVEEIRQSKWCIGACGKDGRQIDEIKQAAQTQENQRG